MQHTCFRLLVPERQGIKLLIKRNIGRRGGEREYRTPVIQTKLADNAAGVASGITHSRH